MAVNTWLVRHNNNYLHSTFHNVPLSTIRDSFWKVIIVTKIFSLSVLSGTFHFIKDVSPPGQSGGWPSGSKCYCSTACLVHVKVLLGVELWYWHKRLIVRSQRLELLIFLVVSPAANWWTSRLLQGKQMFLMKLWKMKSTYLLSRGKITVIIRVVDDHRPVMKVCRQNKWLTKNPVNHCGHLWFAPFQQLILAEADIVPGGESSV